MRLSLHRLALFLHQVDWIKKLDAFLTLNEREILSHAGQISHQMAKELAESEYDNFNLKRIKQNDRALSDFDWTVKQLTEEKKDRDRKE